MTPTDKTVAEVVAKLRAARDATRIGVGEAMLTREQDSRRRNYLGLLEQHADLLLTAAVDTAACDSYANENQRFHDEILSLRATLASRDAELARTKDEIYREASTRGMMGNIIRERDQARADYVIQSAELARCREAPQAETMAGEPSKAEIEAAAKAVFRHDFPSNRLRWEDAIIDDYFAVARAALQAAAAVRTKV